jgi:hypothetical protein
MAGTICGMQNYYNTQSYATLTLPGGGTGQVFDTFMGVGSNTGNGQWGVNLNYARDVFVAFWWSTNPQFEGVFHGHNKMIFIRAETDNNFLNWSGAPDGPKVLAWSPQQTLGGINNCHVAGYDAGADCNTPGGGGNGTFWPNVNSGAATVSAGSGWHKIEIYQKSSTSKTSANGVIRIWVDGVLTSNYTNVNLAPGGFTDFQINHAWDGGMPCSDPRSRDCSREWHHYWSDVFVAIGGTVGAGGDNSGGGEVPPPPPPTQVVLQDLTPANATVTVSGTRQFTISMSGAMATGTSLFTTSSDTAVATVPASVSISQGSSTAVFSATGVATGSTTISTNYNGVTKGATLQVAASGTTGATTTYTYATDFSGTQGPNWYYLEESGTEMTYNGGSSVWFGTDSSGAQTIWGNGFHPGRFAATILRFVVPLAGTATITGAYYDTDTAGGVGAVALVNYNGLTLFTRTIANGDSTGGAYSVTQAVSVGDHIDFVVSNLTADYTYNSTNLDPVIGIAETSTVPNPPPPPDPPASVVDLFTSSGAITKDIPFTLTVRLSKIVTVDTTVEIRVGSTSLVTVATSVTVPAGSNEKSFTATPIQVGNVAIDAILTTTARYNASIQPNPADIPPDVEPDIPPITENNPLTVQRLTISHNGATVELNRPGRAMAFRYDAQPEWVIVHRSAGERLLHTFTWPSGTTTVCYRAQDGDGNWGPSACAPFVALPPPPKPPAVNKGITDRAGIRWQLTGKTSPYILKRNGSSMDNTYGVTLRKSGDGYMEILQTNGVWLRRDGNAWEFVE